MENPNTKEIQKQIVKSLDIAAKEIAIIAYMRKDEHNKTPSDILESFGYSQEHEDFCTIEIKVTYNRGN